MADAAGAGVVAVVPAYQAAATLPAVLDGLREALPGASVLVVDDGSTDGTRRAAERGGARVLRHVRNLGKGSALADGIAEAVRVGAAFVLTIDADGQHPPARAPQLLDPVRNGEADVVIGARRRDAGTMPAARQVSNWLASSLVSRAVGRVVPDSQSGFRAFSARVASAVRPAGSRYEFETEFLFLAAAAGFRLTAVPVPTVYAGAPSHFRYATDTARLSGVFLRHWRTILFGPVAR